MIVTPIARVGRNKKSSCLVWIRINIGLNDKILVKIFWRFVVIAEKYIKAEF